MLTPSNVLEKSKSPDQDNENVSNKLFESALPVEARIVECSRFASRSEETDKTKHIINTSPIRVTKKFSRDIMKVYNAIVVKK